MWFCWKDEKARLYTPITISSFHCKLYHNFVLVDEGMRQQYQQSRDDRLISGLARSIEHTWTGEFSLSRRNFVYD